MVHIRLVFAVSVNTLKTESPITMNRLRQSINEWFNNRLSLTTMVI